MPVNGRLEVTPAALTPGIVRAFSSSRAQNAPRAGASGYRLAGSAIPVVSTRSGENPGFTSCSRPKLLISSPAPTSSINASAVSTMTSVLRTAVVVRLAEPRVASSFSSDDVFPRSRTAAGAEHEPGQEREREP